MNAFPSPPPDEGGLHRTLAHFNARRLVPVGPDAAEDPDQALLIALQNDFIARERAVHARQAACAPTRAEGFLAWFRALRQEGPGQGDALFPWLAERADLAQMRWFLTQEAGGEAGFDDLIALTQVKMPTRPKLEMARNYWDEMGRGQQAGMHGLLLGILVRSLDLDIAIDRTAWPALALSNLMIGFATQRRFAYHAVGALGVIELTAPDRVAQVAGGLRRLGVGAPERRYFDLHAVLDRKHADDWLAEVIAPLVADDPRVAPWIAEGALLRLAAGARCFAHYRQVLAVAEAMAEAHG